MINDYLKYTKPIIISAVIVVIVTYSGNSMADNGISFVPAGIALGYLAHHGYEHHVSQRYRYARNDRYYSKRHYNRRYSGYKKPYYHKPYHSKRYYNYQRPYYGKRSYRYGYHRHYYNYGRHH